jgi:hypothetical protein
MLQFHPAPISVMPCTIEVLDQILEKMSIVTIAAGPTEPPAVRHLTGAPEAKCVGANQRSKRPGAAVAWRTIRPLHVEIFERIRCQPL